MVIVTVIAVAIVAALVAVLRGTSKGDLAAPGDTVAALRPIVAGFHVEGDTATVSYEVPLPPGPVDDHLRQLLLHDAARVVSEKSAAGLPIDQVHRVRSLGLRDGGYVEVGVLDLRQPGVLPELAAPDLVPHAGAAGYDPLAHIGEHEFAVQPGIAGPRANEELQPFGVELELARGVENSLRAGGIDPDGAGLEDLTVGLLTVGGYTLVAVPGAAGPQYLARRGGEETLVAIVQHSPGEHPELSEQVVNGFTVTVAERNPTRALLVTDKFGPYLIHERERRYPKTRFITRERLQAFVDGFALR